MAPNSSTSGRMGEERRNRVMKTAAELYADEFYNDDYFCTSDYQRMLNEFGEIVIQKDDNDCQGDSYVLYRSGTRYGILIFGWGSCSGCDSLQACRSTDEVQELMNELHNDIQWFDSLEEAQDYLRFKDVRGEFWWHRSSGPDFLEAVLNYQELG